MILLRQKLYSDKSGRFWAGSKGALKGAGKGALIGLALMPGKLRALKKEKYKLAGGLAIAGATIGAGIGGRSGWKSGTSQWEYDHDPKVKERVNEERTSRIKTEIENNKGFDKMSVSEFDYSSWKSLEKKLNVPAEFLKYVKFYKDIWSKKIDLWYSSMDLNKIDDAYEVPEFKEYFPIPIDPRQAESWYEEDYLCLATYNDAGDDGYLCYDPEDKTYGVDSPRYSDSLKKILINDTNKLDTTLSNKQIELIKEFNSKINSIL